MNLEIHCNFSPPLTTWDIKPQVAGFAQVGHGNLVIGIGLCSNLTSHKIKITQVLKRKKPNSNWINFKQYHHHFLHSILHPNRAFHPISLKDTIFPFFKQSVKFFPFTFSPNLLVPPNTKTNKMGSFFFQWTIY